VDPAKWSMAVKYREHILKLKVLMSLKINSLQIKSERKTMRVKITSKHPFYVVALIKKKFGKRLREFIDARDNRKSSALRSVHFEQSRLWVLARSLSSQHLKMRFQ
jgi:hypothetical protein